MLSSARISVALVRRMSLIWSGTAAETGKRERTDLPPVCVAKDLFVIRFVAVLDCRRMEVEILEFRKCFHSCIGLGAMKPRGIAGRNRRIAAALYDEGRLLDFGEFRRWIDCLQAALVRRLLRPGGKRKHRSVGITGEIIRQRPIGGEIIQDPKDILAFEAGVTLPAFWSDSNCCQIIIRSKGWAGPESNTIPQISACDGTAVFPPETLPPLAPSADTSGIFDRPLPYPPLRIRSQGLFLRTAAPQFRERRVVLPSPYKLAARPAARGTWGRSFRPHANCESRGLAEGRRPGLAARSARRGFVRHRSTEKA
jgi:hypothetical protein